MDPVLADILSEPSVVAETLAEGDARLPRLVSRLESFRGGLIYAVGAGSSYFAGLAARYALERWAGIPTCALSSKDWATYALPSAPGDSLVLVISQSGETIETVSAAEAARARGLRTLALTNRENSRVARVCDDLILLRAGQEEGPGTKTVVAQCVALCQFALYLSHARHVSHAEAGETAQAQLRALPGMVREMLSDTGIAGIEVLVQMLASEPVLYLVGAGPFWPLTLQAANYLREVSKLHCCPFEATEFRHGPLEALSARSNLLVLTSGQCRAKADVVRACEAAAGVGARILYLGDAEGLPGVALSAATLLPSADEILAAQVYLAPLHLIGYRIAKRKGLDPNRFEHMVKTWTE